MSLSVEERASASAGALSAVLSEKYNSIWNRVTRQRERFMYDIELVGADGDGKPARYTDRVEHIDEARGILDRTVRNLTGEDVLEVNATTVRDGRPVQFCYRVPGPDGVLVAFANITEVVGE